MLLGMRRCQAQFLGSLFITAYALLPLEAWVNFCDNDNNHAATGCAGRKAQNSLSPTGIGGNHYAAGKSGI